MDISSQKNKGNINDNNKLENNSPSIKGLQQFLQNQPLDDNEHRIPPLDQWHPKNCGKMNLIIKANGDWYHEGEKMTRQSLINLFATVLWQEVDEGKPKFFLKTPIEKIEIQVEDAPLFINEVNIVFKKDDLENDIAWLQFQTTTGDIVTLDNNHPIYFRTYQGETRPYMMVRNNLEALIGRNVFYHLIDIGKLAEDKEKTTLTLISGSQTFSLNVQHE